MAFSQANLDAIEAAIASGALTVKFGDREVQYRSMADMMQARDVIRRALGLTNRNGGRTFARFSKGIHNVFKNYNGTRG